MTKPLLVLLCLAAAGLGSVVLMPKHIEILPSAVKMDWPVSAGDWVKVRDTEPSPQEIAILARDTGFSKAEYIHAASNARLDVGIVLSGMDPNNSIHRPERCLVAQGHSNLEQSALTVPMADGNPLPLTRLHTRIDREIPTESGKPETLRLNFVTYYWFVGNTLITGSHYGRTLQDITDRLFRGANQRWAYITVGITLRDTEESRALAHKTDSDVDRILQDFLANVIPLMIDRGIIDGEAKPAAVP